jgi:dihydrofolate reductase
MRKLNVFNFVTLNGYFKGPGGDISWHRHGGEENEFSKEGAQSGSVILFGRVTYEMMASYWPTPQASKDFPEVAEGMNKSEKIDFSTTLNKADPIVIGWNNTKVIKGNIIEEIRKMKQTPGKDMIVLGSGSIVTQFAEKDLIDTYQFMVDPVALGDGTPIFKGIGHKLDLKLMETKTFKSGVVLLSYRSLKK